MPHHHDHSNRDDPTGEHTTGDAGQIILAILFAGIWIADIVFFHYTTILNDYVPAVVRIPIGIIILIIAGYLARKSMAIVFGEVRGVPAVIRKSIFDKVRHPMYLSEILLYLGLLLLNISIAAGIVWIVTIIFLHLISRHEEKLLLDRFGEDYKKYMQEVPMWIPRLLKK